jgi:hypothetical protein
MLYKYKYLTLSLLNYDFNIIIIIIIITTIMIRGSTVGIKTGYGPQDREVEI